MASYESLPTMQLAKNNELLSPAESLPALVHLNDDAKTIFIDFSKTPPITASPPTAIDIAIRRMEINHQNLLLVESQGQVVGTIGIEAIVGEAPIRLMQERGITRAEITVEMLMKKGHQILVIDHSHLRNAQVGHIITTLKEHSAHYLLVVKKTRDRHLIKGFFSASQIGKQLHSDLSSVVIKEPETIAHLRKQRKM